MICDTRPSHFSACNIEKLGVAWGRGYITCTSLNTCILPVLLFACISVSYAGSTGCVPNHMLLDKRAKKHHIANVVLSTNSYYYPRVDAFYSPGECGQSSFYCVCCCM